MAAQAPAFWQGRGPVAQLLRPLSCLFGALAARRRAAIVPQRLPVPVIVVGNIAVGGSGKTPVVDWLAAQLRAAGRRPGIVSRGHGGRISAQGGVAVVPADGDADHYGDEPVLLARLTGCPLAIGRDRPAAARELLRLHPDCDVLIADDGMQHYRLARDLEIAVVDEATLGNRLLLPAGPLREPLARLGEVDLI
nr:tetraacyldisaccharide 4'-kinase [Thauera sp.]